MAPLAWDQVVTHQLEQARQELATKAHLPQVAKIRSRTGTDSTGDPAVWIWVVLKSGTPAAQMTHEHLKEIADRIRGYFYKQPVVLAPAGVYPPPASGPMPYFAPVATPYVYFEREEERP